MLYYKELVGLAFTNFFNDYNELFVKENNMYIFSGNFSKSKLEGIFKTYISNAIKQLAKPWNIFEPTYFFLIGSCLPKNNLLLKYSDKSKFPKSLQKIIDSPFQIKWILKEQDIRIDSIMFNTVLFKIFDQMFKSPKRIQNWLGKEYKNIFFIQHNNLDCYAIFKILKFAFGKSNCVNIHQEKMNSMSTCIVAINELIEKYANNKHAVNKSLEFKTAMVEIQQYADSCRKNLK